MHKINCHTSPTRCSTTRQAEFWTSWEELPLAALGDRQSAPADEALTSPAMAGNWINLLFLNLSILEHPLFFLNVVLFLLL